jgi:sugar phosphate isomerase/epimerase
MIELCVFSDEVSHDVEEQADLCARAGATCIEARGHIFGHAIQDCTDGDLDNLQAILARYGMRVAVIGSPVGKCDLDDPSQLETHQRWFARMCQIAHRFDTRIIRGFAFWTPGRAELPRPDLAAVVERIGAALSPIARMARQEDVLLCLESEGATCSGTCAEIAAIIGHTAPGDNVMVAWDVNNAAVLGEHPLREGYPLIRERIRHLHVKPDSHKSIQTAADTDVSYADVLRRLLADGYQGVATVEHWGSRWLMLEGVRQLRALLDELQPA